MQQLVFFVPVSHAEKVKEACFEAGAGRYGNYDRCCFECAGTGQFRPLEGADPFIGENGRTEKVAELRIEMICEDTLVEKVRAALRRTHPYEEPAYHFTAISGL